MADIKERLRAPPDLSDIHIICKAAGELREAVDRITALEAEVERMRAALSKAVRDMDRLGFTPDWLKEARAALKEPRT
jgi:uncharacterized protein (UPF0335 family)